MIKLKDILFEVFEEARRRGSASGAHTINAEFDGRFIPGLTRDTDTIEVSAEVDYDFDPGSRGSWNEPPEGASVELGRFEITGVLITPEQGEQVDFDVRFLHPQQRKALEALMEDYIETNSQDIESSILDGASE